MKTATRWRKRRGNASVELALSAAFMLTTMFGIVDYGRMFAVANTVSSAARAGTLYGSLDVTKNNDIAGMEAAAKTDAQNSPGLTATASQFCTCSLGGSNQTCQNSCPAGLKRTYIKVVVKKTFNTAFRYPGLPNSIPLSSTSVVRVN